MTNPLDDLNQRLASLLGKESQQQSVASEPKVNPSDAIDGVLDRLNDLSDDADPGLPPQAAPSAIPAGPSESTAAPAQPGAPARRAPGPSPRRRAPSARPTAQAAAPPQTEAPPTFLPSEPESFEDAGLNESVIEELVLKYLYVKGEASGQRIAEQVKLSFTMLNDLFAKLKYDQLIQYKDTAALNDYVLSLTEVGRERARRYSARCTYFGAAPVPLKDYIESVGLQSLQHQNPGRDDLERAFSDLLINKTMFLRLGAAMNSGRGMFLFGFPGNGKTSIAERVTKAFGEFIWIPRAIIIEGELIRMFDPAQHEAAPLTNDGGLISNQKIDHRWVRIKRPTIIVGGELTMDNLELSYNPSTGINEAPLQLKSNTGTLVIDDFGRQRMTTDELLNRWIVPLEKRYDFLNLPSGKKIQVPFDQLVVFSTNLEPKDLVDDAFLRRIPYKIEVKNPTEEEFRELFKIMCPIMKFEHDEKCVTYLIEKHYKPINRPFRCCQPRDLLLQIKNFCLYLRRPVVMSPENFDFAASNYFAVM